MVFGHWRQQSLPFRCRWLLLDRSRTPFHQKRREGVPLYPSMRCFFLAQDLKLHFSTLLWQHIVKGASPEKASQLRQALGRAGRRPLIFGGPEGKHRGVGSVAFPENPSPAVPDCRGRSAAVFAAWVRDHAQHVCSCPCQERGRPRLCATWNPKRRSREFCWHGGPQRKRQTEPQGSR